jgi:hypothetical protein
MVLLLYPWGKFEKKYHKIKGAQKFAPLLFCNI